MVRPSMITKSIRVNRLNLITITLMLFLFGYLYHASTYISDECKELEKKISQDILEKIPRAMKTQLTEIFREEVKVESHTAKSHTSGHENQHTQPAEDRDVSRLILAYTKIYGTIFNASTYGRKEYEWRALPDPLSECQYKCKWSTDIQDLSKADAVLFHIYNNQYTKDFVLGNIPPRNMNNSHQKWIFMAREPQAFYYPDQLNLLNDMFNLTITFQQDSDVTIPYGAYWDLNEKSKKFRKTLQVDYHKGRTKLVAWIASNCVTSSRRENYVQELNKYIPIDIYGKCGNLTTSTKDANGFRREISSTYMFYLAFENSDCIDYVSEKFWNSLDAGIIPVVRGLKVNYKHLAPPNSYIQAENFINGESLAAYLKEVASNETLYNSFHNWRRLYDAKYKFFTVNSQWMCELCEKVHTSERKTVSISQHFSEDARCFTYLSQNGRNREGEHVEDITRP